MCASANTNKFETKPQVWQTADKPLYLIGAIDQFVKIPCKQSNTNQRQIRQGVQDE